MDTTQEMTEGQFSISEVKCIDITLQVKTIAKNVGPLKCLYIPKNELTQIISKLKLKKFGLEIVFKVFDNQKKVYKRLSLRKIDQPLFLCPDLADLPVV